MISWIKSNIKKILITGNIFLFVLSIVFLLGNLRVSVSMKQTQHQNTEVKSWNINQNQNININTFYGNYDASKKIVYQYVVIKTTNDFVRIFQSLNFFQQTYVKQYKGILFYPTYLSKIITNELTFTVLNTNFNVNSVTNKTLWQLF